MNVAPIIAATSARERGLAQAAALRTAPRRAPEVTPMPPSARLDFSRALMADPRWQLCPPLLRTALLAAAAGFTIRPGRGRPVDPARRFRAADQHGRICVDLADWSATVGCAVRSLQRALADHEQRAQAAGVAPLIQREARRQRNGRQGANAYRLDVAKRDDSQLQPAKRDDTPQRPRGMTACRPPEGTPTPDLARGSAVVSENLGVGVRPFAASTDHRVQARAEKNRVAIALLVERSAGLAAVLVPLLEYADDDPSTDPLTAEQVGTLAAAWEKRRTRLRELIAQPEGVLWDVPPGEVVPRLLAAARGIVDHDRAEQRAPQPRPASATSQPAARQPKSRRRAQGPPREDVEPVGNALADVIARDGCTLTVAQDCLPGATRSALADEAVRQINRALDAFRHYRAAMGDEEAAWEHVAGQGESEASRHPDWAIRAGKLLEMAAS